MTKYDQGTGWETLSTSWEMPLNVEPAMSSGPFLSQAQAWDLEWQRTVKCLSLLGKGKGGVKAAVLRFTFEKGAEKMQHRLCLCWRGRSNVHFE